MLDSTFYKPSYSRRDFALQLWADEASSREVRQNLMGQRFQFCFRVNLKIVDFRHNFIFDLFCTPRDFIIALIAYNINWKTETYCNLV